MALISIIHSYKKLACGAQAPQASFHYYVTIKQIKDNYFSQNGSVIMAIILFWLVFDVIIAIM